MSGQAGISAQEPRKPDRLEQASRVLTLGTFGLAVIVFIITPILALTWIRQPFPGFFVEQTLVVNDNKAEGWSGWSAGITYLQHVIRIGGAAVSTPAEFNAVIASSSAGQEVSVFTEFPDGSTRLYPSITLGAFSKRDVIRFFWLPYFIALAYLGIGVWIYMVGGKALPGRALSFFCFWTAIACALIFDLSTTHLGTLVYTAGIALLGGALVSLAMRFPVEWKLVQYHRWVLAVPYGVSMVLIIWNLLVLNDTTHPWAYISSWRGNYLYAGFGILIFLGLMIYRAVTSKESLTRRQARVVLSGSSVAFVPVTIWFIAPLFHLQVHFNIILFLPPLILFPLSTGLAIFRYRLWQIDTFVNRTIVYGLLTAILAGLYTASIGLSQRIFVAVTGNKSDAAIVLTTLIVASAFTPLKTHLQGFVDKQFKEQPDHTRALRTFGEQIHSFIQMNDVEQITRRLLDEAIHCLHAENGAITMLDKSQYKTIHTNGLWKGDVRASIPIECDDTRYGFLLLGPRKNGGNYTQQDTRTLQQVAKQVAQAIKQVRSFINPSLQVSQSTPFSR